SCCRIIYRASRSTGCRSLACCSCLSSCSSRAASWVLSGASVSHEHPSMSVLDVRNVTKRFGNLVAVQNVSLLVEKGEFRAIIGPNGAGKTTFFNLISGFFQPTSGSIAFDGRDVTSMPADQRVTRGMARTFQITEIFPQLSVFENVRIGAEVAA